MNARSAAACILALAVGIAIGYALAPNTGAGKSAPVSVAAAVDEQDLLVRSGMLATALEVLEPGNPDPELGSEFSCWVSKFWNLGIGENGPPV